MTDHDFIECNCGKMGCAFCNGVKLCKKCNGAIGVSSKSSLTKQCCGHVLGWDVLDYVLNKKLDYVHGKWVNEKGQPVDLPMFLGLDDICGEG